MLVSLVFLLAEKIRLRTEGFWQGYFAEPSHWDNKRNESKQNVPDFRQKFRKYLLIEGWVKDRKNVKKGGLVATENLMGVHRCAETLKMLAWGRG